MADNLDSCKISILIIDALLACKHNILETLTEGLPKMKRAEILREVEDWLYSK
jgi:hypothetical protein